MCPNFKVGKKGCSNEIFTFSLSFDCEHMNKIHEMGNLNNNNNTGLLYSTVLPQQVVLQLDYHSIIAHM